MNDLICVNCESENVTSCAVSKDLRPNGEPMEVYECEDCGQVWKE